MKVTRSNLRTALTQHFGHKTFRPLQEDIVSEVLAGKDVYANLPTSAGKSLCYQLPSQLLPGLTIVASPLIALQHDQVAQLTERGIAAAYINSTLDDKELREMFRRVTSGEAKLLYLSPEKLATNSIYDELADVEVSLLAVDEAHCISMWGHDFRPSYGKLAEARTRLGKPTLMMLTATAPVHVRNDILSNLEADDAECFIGPIERDNLELNIEHFAYSYQKDAWLFPRLRRHSKAKEATIVYCRRVSEVKALAEELESQGKLNVDVYYGKMEPPERKQAEKKFYSGITTILIATKAFGMGVDKPNIRHVYHYALPESLEEYWQEVGRAGRDGKPSTCTLMYMPRDTKQLKRFIAAANPQLSFIEKVWNALTSRLKGGAWAADVPQMDFYMRLWAERFAGNDPSRATTVIAAITQLEQYGLIETQGSTLHFLYKPKDVKEFGFPIQETDLQAKRDAAILRLKIMIYFALHGKDDPMAIIAGHFNHNSIVDEVEDMDLDAMYQVPDEHLRSILEALSERDFLQSEFAGYLGGRNSASGVYRGSLKHLNPDEIRMDIGQAATLTYVREVPVGRTTMLTLALDGESFLRESCGVELAQHERWTEMKKRMLSTPSKRYLKKALANWWRSVDASHAKRNWDMLREFMGYSFDILDKKLTGLQLVAQFARKRAVLSQANRGNSTSTQKTGVLLKDAKLFLEWLYNTKIDTF